MLTKNKNKIYNKTLKLKNSKKKKFHKKNKVKKYHL